MLPEGAAKKVTIYVNEDTRYHHGPLYEALLEFLQHKQVAGATASRCLAGFGAHQQMHTPKIEVRAEHLPIRIDFIETPQRVQELLPILNEMLTDGLIEVQDTDVVKIAREDAPQPQPRPASERKQGPAKMMRVYLGEADRADGKPLYEAIVERLRTMDIAGATVNRGVLGYGAKGHTHRESFLHISKDLPIMISVVASPQKIAEAAAVVEEMLGDGLIVLSDVECIRLVRAASPPL